MTIFFSVGEPSGDLHGANLIGALRRTSGDAIRFVGFGGPKMAAAGAELHHDLTAHAVMGFLQVVGVIPRFLRLAAEAEDYFREHRPDAVVLVDFPGFNWHIARRAKRHGVPVFYYGTPQLWGWAPWRVRKLRRWVDHALCKLPFEEAWLRERGCNATHVGHPYFDELHGRRLDEIFLAEQRDAPGPLVTLLPGSRTQEVKANLATLLEAARLVRQQAPNARFAVAAFKPAHAERVRAAIAAKGFADGPAPSVHVGRTPELIEAARCCLAVSGSVSLELLHHAKPTAITYRVSWPMHQVQKLFRRVRYITLVNLLTTDELFPKRVGVYDPADPRDAHALMPEYLTWRDPAPSLARHAVEWLTDEPKRDALVRRMHALRDQIGAAGASERAAEYLLRELPGAAASRAA
ncbi:lipid-A-disaccharide synthase [Botrimarina sp.]|uniref:lipid-A-disaccharide synthase n=1 Tax=Botrimarina sp. TaxID=2795802 RepID=UPI0032EF3804